jgi:zinc transport system ATP-binding protein
METVSEVLDVERLTVRLGQRTVLSELSFHVPRGSTLAVIGPNGSGKTVLLRTLVGGLPYEGTIRWAPGTRLGYVPQKLDIERDLPLSGWDFLAAAAQLARVPTGEVMRALRQVDLEPAVTHRHIGALSGGQFQLLLVAFAILASPTVLLLDEPTAGIDAPSQEHLNEMLHRLQVEQGVTLLLVSHDLSIVSRYATQVLCLARGEYWLGPPQEVVTPERLQALYGTPVRFHVHDDA